MHREGVANELHLEVTDELMSCEDEKGRRTVGRHDRGRRRRLERRGGEIARGGAGRPSIGATGTNAAESREC